MFPQPQFQWVRGDLAGLTLNMTVNFQSSSWSQDTGLLKMKWDYCGVEEEGSDSSSDEEPPPGTRRYHQFQDWEDHPPTN